MGESDVSSVVLATTTPSLPPGQATITNIDTYADEASFQISVATSGNVSSNIDAFWVECTAPDGSVVTGTSATSSVMVVGLQEGVSYSCEAYAENMAGPGGQLPRVMWLPTVSYRLPIWLLFQATQSP